MLLSEVTLDSTFTVSIGALLTLCGVAVGYGGLKNKVASLIATVLRLELEAVQRDKDIKELQEWKAYMKGRQSGEAKAATGNHKAPSL